MTFLDQTVRVRIFSVVTDFKTHNKCDEQMKTSRIKKFKGQR